MNDPIIGTIVGSWQLSLCFAVSFFAFGWGYVGTRVAMEKEEPKLPVVKIVVGIVGLVGFIDCLIRALGSM